MHRSSFILVLWHPFILYFVSTYKLHGGTYFILYFVPTYIQYVINDIIGKWKFIFHVHALSNNSLFYFLFCPHALFVEWTLESLCIGPVSIGTGPVTSHANPVTVYAYPVPTIPVGYRTVYYRY